MNLEDLLGGMQIRRAVTADLDDVIGEDMMTAKINLNEEEKDGPVRFSQRTLDQLLDLSEGRYENQMETEDDGSACKCFKCQVIRRTAKLVYDLGAETTWKQVMERHRQARTIIEVVNGMESSYAWKKRGMEVVIAFAKELGLPERAAVLQEHLDNIQAYLDRIPKMHAEMDCYGDSLKAKEEFNATEEQPQPVIAV